MPLVHVAQRLRSPDIDRIVKPFREASASRRRAILLAGALLWTIGWSRAAPSHFLAGEATRLLPAMAAVVALAIGWSFFTNLSKHANKPWVDVVGTVLDFLAVAFMLSQAWNLMLPFVGLLPLACVNAGARFKPIWFHVSVAAALLIVALSAPAGYWFSRPAVAILAIVLVAGIPMTFNRVLQGLSRISEQAIIARDSQSRFLAMMSHELRTPLHTVINAASLVDSYREERMRAPLIRSITTNANVLLSRVNDMLDVAASQAGVIAASDGEPFDLRYVIQTVQAILSEQAVERGTLLTFMYDTERPTILRGNPRRIEQVITNLAGNAIKYTPRGGSVLVTATASPVLNAAQQAELVISVADTGIGIPDDQKSKIFDAFHQVSSGDGRTHGGVGLGLHIIKQISLQVEATIAVEDNPGGGTVFIWRQKLATSDATLIPAHDIATSEILSKHAQSTRSLRCLVVDDNSSNRDIMGRILSMAGHNAEFAVDGEQAMAKLGSSRYDITFLDLHMPGMSGLEVLQALREQGRDGETAKVVILTASTDMAATQRAAELDAYGFLHKPLSIAALLETLKSAAEGRSYDMADVVTNTNPLETMRMLSDETGVRAYLHKALNELKDSMDAVSMAPENIDGQERGALVHRLKNSLINAGASLSSIKPYLLDDTGLTHGQLQELLPGMHRIVATTVSGLSSAPEMT